MKKQNSAKHSKDGYFKRKKDSHLRSVQDGSILYYFYKGIAILKDMILGARDSLSKSIENNQRVKQMEDDLDLDNLQEFEKQKGDEY